MPYRIRSPRRSAVAWFVCLLWAAPALADEVALVPDAALKPPGGRYRGQIQAETPTDVTILVGSNPQKVPLNQIDSITYDGQSANYVRGNSLASGGDFAAAAEAYQKAAGETAGKPLAAQAAQFGRARSLAEIALADPSRRAEAITALTSFSTTYANGRHVVPALDYLARLQMHNNDFGPAGQTVAKLATIATSVDRSAILGAQLQARQGEHGAAVSALEKLAASAPEGSALRREAMLTRAESLAALKKFDEAEAEVRKVIAAAPAEDVEVQAAAYNTLGDCLRVAGKPKDALLAYLHTDILYAKNKEEHPKALSQIVRLWRELKRDDRADEALDRLRQEYPQSPYLASASGTAPK